LWNKAIDSLNATTHSYKALHHEPERSVKVYRLSDAVFFPSGSMLSGIDDYVGHVARDINSMHPDDSASTRIAQAYNRYSSVAHSDLSTLLHTINCCFELTLSKIGVSRVGVL